MKPLKRVALIGNHLPRRCGIATFTHDLHQVDLDGTPGSGNLRRCHERSRCHL